MDWWLRRAASGWEPPTEEVNEESGREEERPCGKMQPWENWIPLRTQERDRRNG